MTGHKTYRVYFSTDQGEAFLTMHVNESVKDKGQQAFVQRCIQAQAKYLGATNPVYLRKVEVNNDED